MAISEKLKSVLEALPGLAHDELRTVAEEAVRYSKIRHAQKALTFRPGDLVEFDMPKQRRFNVVGTVRAVNRQTVTVDVRALDETDRRESWRVPAGVLRAPTGPVRKPLIDLPPIPR